MKKITLSTLVVISTFTFGLAAHAEVSLMAARIGAEDVASLARFYEEAFELKEVNRLEFPGVLEVMLNFGDTVEAATANGAAQLVIMTHDSDDLDHLVPHIIFNVTDMAATVAAVEAAGGTMDSEPQPFGDSGMVVGFGADPAGNPFELIQQPTP